MKFKRFLAVLLVAVVAVTVFAGCDVITKSTERDINQQLAVVNYEGLSAVVTKGEFSESFNSIGYYYVMYYGYTVEEAAQAILDSLSDRKLLILYVRVKTAEQLGVEKTSAVESLLNEIEKNEAVKAANKTMQSWYDDIYNELLKEKENADKEEEEEEKPEEEEEEEKKEDPRPSRPDVAEPEIDYDGPLNPDDKEVPFFEQDNHYAEDATSEQKIISDKAVAELKKRLEKSFRDYGYYLNSQYETQLLSKYQRSLGANYTLESEAVKLLVRGKRDEYIQLNKEKFSGNTEANYKAALGNLSNLVYTPESQKGYGYVFNTLFKFSDEQTAKLEAFKKEQTDEEVIKAYRAALANEITVNVTNPDYDPEHKCEECDNSETPPCDNPDCPSKMYTRENVPVITIINEIYAELQAVENNAELSTPAKFKAKREIVTKWLYLVNDDKGMYDTEKNNAFTNNGLGYLITPEGAASDWVKEFTDLGRALINGTGNGENGAGEGQGAYGYCVTDYGIHMMFVSYVPFDEKRITAENDKTNGYIPLDYVVYYGREGDANDPDKTLEDMIFKSLKDLYIQQEYEKDAQSAISKYSDSIKRNDKLWKKIMKELEKASAQS